MRRTVALLALLLLVPLASAITITRPAYSPGDHWDHQITVVEGGRVVGEGERRDAVLGEADIVHGGATRRVIQVGTFENLTVDGQRTSRRVTTSYDTQTGAFLQSTTQDGDRIAAEPCLQIRYPFEYPGGWTTRCTIDGAEVETQYMVAGGERLVLPAGAFDTISVDHFGDEGSGRLWFAQETCGRPVAEFEQTNDRATYVNLTGYACRSTAPASPPPTSPGQTTPPPATTPSPTARPLTTPAPAGATPTPAQPTSSAPLAYPILTEGDAWFYHANITLQGKRFQVQTREVVQLALNDSRYAQPDTPMDTLFHIDELHEGAIGSFSESTWAFEPHYRRSDGALLYETARNYNTKVPDPAGPPTTRSYDVPCIMVKWPITPGTTWRIDCRGRAEEPPVLASEYSTNFRNFTLTGEGRAEAVRRVTVPAGTFDGYPVTLSYRTSDGLSRTQTLVFAREACGVVERIPGFLATDQRDTLSSFRCQSLGTGTYVPPTPGTSEAPAAPFALVALGVVAAALLAKKRS